MEDLTLYEMSLCLVIVRGEQTRKRRLSWNCAVFEDGHRHRMILLDKLLMKDALPSQIISQLLGIMLELFRYNVRIMPHFLCSTVVNNRVSGDIMAHIIDNYQDC